jgi:hypothetical protein
VTRSEAGRLGGRRTLELYGRAHFQALGRKGFNALANRLGYVGGGRRAALARLAARGRIHMPGPPDLTPAELEALYHRVGLGEPGPAPPSIVNPDTSS